MSLKYFCLFVLQLRIAASIAIIGGGPFDGLIGDIENGFGSDSGPIAKVGKVLKVVRKIRKTRNAIPKNVPKIDMLEPGLSYLPEGAGCTSQPEWAKTAPEDTPAIKFNVPGWNGFCQSGWSLCSDAIANKDYSYYWRGLGPDYAVVAAKIDGEYCRKNGWLKPEFRKILNNFTALQAKGEEECRTKWNKPEYQMNEAHLKGIGRTLKQSVKDWTGTAMKTGIMRSVKSSDVGKVVMSEHGAGMAAAWNCAMGSISCDIAYCNHAYCELYEGVVGTTEECPGWDAFRGMPVPTDC